MRFDIVTLFPNIIEAYFKEGIVSQGIEKGLVEVNTVDLRQFGKGNYKQVDDHAFGDGAGMVLMFDPVRQAIESIEEEYKRLGLQRQGIAKKHKKTTSEEVVSNNPSGFNSRIDTSSSIISKEREKINGENKEVDLSGIEPDESGVSIRPNHRIRPTDRLYQKVLTESLQNTYSVVALTAKGEVLKQSTVKRFKAENSAMILLCGRYEGFDQRILDLLVDEEISLGNFVMSGGEVGAMAVVDTIARLIPGVLNTEESFETDSFYEDDKTVQHPQYTRPREIEYKGKTYQVPEVLFSGNHAEIKKWRENNST